MNKWAEEFSECTAPRNRAIPGGCLVCMWCRTDLAENYMNDQKETAFYSPMYVYGVGNNHMGAWALFVAVCLEIMLIAVNIDVSVGEVSCVIMLLRHRRRMYHIDFSH
jgi:hypothetical protein